MVTKAETAAFHGNDFIVVPEAAAQDIRKRLGDSRREANEDEQALMDGRIIFIPKPRVFSRTFLSNAGYEVHSEPGEWKGMEGSFFGAKKAGETIEPEPVKTTAKGNAKTATTSAG